MAGQFLVVFGREGHHLYLDIGKVFLGDVDGLGEIRHPCLGWILTCHEQDVFERSQLLDGLILVFNLFGREDGACHRVFSVKAAIDAGIGAGVGDVERYEHRHRLAKSLLCVFARQTCHCFEIRLCGR